MHARELRGRVRAGLIGAALVTLTLAGHTAAGGTLDALGTALVVALALALAGATVRSRMPLVLLLALLSAGQVILHLILTVAGGHAHTAGSAPSGASGTPMLVAHAVATVLAAAAILGIDGIVERWLHLLRAVLGWALHLAPVPDAHPARPLGRRAPATALLVLRHGVIRRGPPRPGLLALA